MTARHTLGPWAVRPEDPDIDDKGWLAVDSRGDTVASIEPKLRDAEELANARLIAAAPDLLGGCMALLGLIQLIGARDDIASELQEVLGSNHRIAEAEAAVAKAMDGAR